jgi:hypothetical protein
MSAAVAVSTYNLPKILAQTHRGRDLWSDCSTQSMFDIPIPYSFGFCSSVPCLESKNVTRD